MLAAKSCAGAGVMSDIIKDAKQLLGGATPGKWRAADSDIIAEDSNRFIATVSEYSGLDDPSEEYANVQLIAAAPELAQALAEETWEYIVQVKRADQWQFYIGESHLPTDKPGLANGFSKFEHALEFSKMETEYPTRIVRRRVSPPEVINE